MGIKEKIMKIFRKKGGIIGQTPDDLLLFKTIREMYGTPTLQNAYADAVWVYASIKKIVDNISSLPLILEENKNGQKVEAPISLFFNEIEDLSIQELLELTVLSLEVYGEGFWYLDRSNITEKPNKIIFLHPKKMQPSINDDGKIIGWVYDNTLPLLPFEVIYFKYQNPYNNRGMSPLTPARVSIESDFYAGQYNKTFFKNGAAVGGFIKVDGYLDDRTFERLLQQFNDRHSGVEHSHKVGILEGGADFIELRTSFRDMEFVELKKVSREEIFAAFGTNPVILGLYEDVKSYEGIKSIHKAFWIETLLPKISKIEGKLNQVLSKIDGGRYTIRFDLSNVEALRENINDKVDIAFKLWRMGYPINMINEKLNLGMDEVEWGNEWWIPPTLFPVDGEITPPEPKKQLKKKV